MDLTWYSRSDFMTDVVAELGSLHRHVRDRLGRHGLRVGDFPGILNHDPLFGF